MQDEKTVTKILCDLLDRIAKLYQIPNYDEVNSILLAEWILDEYKHHDLELVQISLRKPPVSNDQQWRLTPDTLKNWIEHTRIKREIEKDKILSEERQNAKVLFPPLSEETIAMIKQHEAELKENLTNRTPKLNDYEVKRLGADMDQFKSQSRKYTPPTVEEVEQKERHQQYLREKWNHDQNPANRDDQMIKVIVPFMSEEEWNGQ